MEIAFKVVKDANFFLFFFFNRTIAAAGWITSQFGNWRKRYHSKGREQIVSKDFSRKENSSEVVGWSKWLRWIIGPVVSKLVIIFVPGAILESLFTQSLRSFQPVAACSYKVSRRGLVCGLARALFPLKIAVVFIWEGRPARLPRSRLLERRSRQTGQPSFLY